MAGIEIRLLGAFEVVKDDRPLALGGNLLRSLLAVLAMAAGETVSSTAIGAALWGQVAVGNVHGRVRTSITRLRYVLGHEALPAAAKGYRLDIDADAVDALRFLRLCDAAAAAEGTESERELLTAALSLWRGRPFDGIGSGWLEQTYEPRLTDRYLNTLERRIDLDLADDRTPELIAELTGLVEQYPLRQSLWARLLIALDRRGRPAEALRRYETVRRLLINELGTAPGAELRRIHADLLAADSNAPRPAQSLAPSVPMQLPSDINRFTGRDDALRDLDELLRAGNEPARPIVIAAVRGTAGIGKTALAVHWAHRVRDRFPDGQLFVNLRGYGPGPPMEPAAALDILLRGLGVPGQQIPDDVDSRRALLARTIAGRRIAIILDNAVDTAQVQPLLPETTCQILVTSRNQLRELATDYSAHLITLNQLTPHESVRYLAKTLHPRHRPTDESNLAELAELCGHLPLALAIAAEAAQRSPDVVEQLRAEQTRLDTLDIDDQATSLRAVFSWSYRALDPDAARCFRLLSLHPGSDFGSRSVATLIGTPIGRAVELLDRLTDDHLVRQTAPDRYQQHDLVRAYATELCTDDQDARLADLYGWYVQSAANARRTIGAAPLPIHIGEPRPDAATFDSSADALVWFDQERQNLIAAVHQAANRGQHQAAYRITFTMNIYLTHRYLLDDVLALQRVATQSAKCAGERAAVATSCLQLAMTLGRRAQYEEAIVHLEESLRLYELADSDLGKAAAVLNLGFVLSEVGRTDDAITRYRQALDITSRLGELDGQAFALNNLGLAFVDLEQYDDAEESCRRAVEIHRARGDMINLARASDSLGQALAGQHRYREAIDEYRTSLALRAKDGDRWSESTTLVSLGTAQRAIGDLDGARTSWQRALDLYDELDASDTPELRRADLVARLKAVTKP